MVDAGRQVAFEGFYDDVLPFPRPLVAMMKRLPDDSAGDEALYGLGSTDGGRLVASG
jgi:hypothetical protein